MPRRLALPERCFGPLGASLYFWDGTQQSADLARRHVPT